MCFSRMGLAFINASTSKKFLQLIYLSIISNFLVILMIQIKAILGGIYLAAVIFGLSYSSLYTLVFVLPVEYNLILSSSQAGNIVISGVIA